MKLPEGFVCEFDGLEEGLSRPPSVSVRFNRGKGCRPPEGSDTVAWCDNGCYLPQRPQFTFDVAMHQGLYYVQDASSMIHSRIVARLAGNRPVNYLDACAAPGGKTTAAIDALPAGSLVVANEFVYQRASVLNENLKKWGYPNCIVTRGDTARFRKTKEMFDIIAADVPCSGEGMFRKDEEAVAQWTPRLVEECAMRQREIIGNLWPALRPGGYFIYSTCTFNRKENEDIADFILTNFDAEAVDPDFPEEWGIVSRGNCRHFIPGRIRGEGLTVAVFRKAGTAFVDEPRQKGKKKDRPVKNAVKLPDDVRNWIAAPEDYEFAIEGETVVASPTSTVAKAIISACDVVSHGVEVATVKGHDFIPTQGLALSTLLNREAFPSVEVDYPTAIAYLRKDTVTLCDAPRGFVLLTYRDIPLGFVKNLGNRANNLYPSQWRILSTPKDSVSGLGLVL